MSDTSSPLEANIKANNAKLCIYITYLGQGNLTLYSNETTSATSVILPNNQSWTTSRYIFNLNRGKGYKLSINPSFNDIGKIEKFLLGYIRVCNEEEYKVSKYKEYKMNKVGACGVLNETFIRTNMSKQLDSPFVFSCEKGHFGANCDMKCSDIDGLSDCKSVIACSSTSCSCLPGYHGDGCNQECGPNKYGSNCQDDCGICDEGKECFHSNGSCPGNVCAARFSGTLCKTPCIGGTYGKNCAHNCSQQCKNGHVFCNATNGICTHGCKTDEFRPPTCDKRLATVTKISLSGNGDESLQIDVNVDFDDVNLLSSYQVQVREQSTTDWKNNTYGSWIFNGKLIKLTVNNLKPKTAYAIRVLLIENDDKFYENKNILYVITSCIPAKAKEDFNVKRDANLKTIEIRLFNDKQSAEHCKMIDYDIYLNGNAIRMDIKTTDSGQVTLEQLQDSIDEINIKIQQISNPKVYFELYGNKKRMNGAKDITILPQVNATPSLLLENNSTLQISAAVFCTALVTMCIFIVVIMIMKKKWHRIMTNQIDLSHPISVPNPVLIASPISTANFTSGNPILEVEEVVYDEIDLSKAVEVPAPEVNQHVIPTVSNRPEPVHYDVVQEPQPMLPWIKSLQDNRQSGTVQNTVDEGGYEVPVSRSNVAESSK